jgi:hypothetical protein
MDSVARLPVHVDETPLESGLELPEIGGLPDKERAIREGAVGAAREHLSAQRIRTCGGVWRGTLRTRSGSPVEPQEDVLDAPMIAHDLAREPDLLTAYRHLKQALANPRIRDAALTTLHALARESE